VPRYSLGCGHSPAAFLVW